MVPPTEVEPSRFDLSSEPYNVYADDDHYGPRRLWLHVLLFVTTLFTTTLVGAHMMYEFRHLPIIEPEIGGTTVMEALRAMVQRLIEVFSTGLRSPAAFASGLPFSLTLLTILMAHEMGHYIACVWYNVDATLPFFLPSPVPLTGTFGAFIRIRSHIPTRKVLFDIGVAGPLAGFVFLAPALFIGLAFSQVFPGINARSPVQLGVPFFQWLAHHVVFGKVPVGDVYLHPMARAAWIGMLATAINLLPAGQLDGGHIVYALFGRAHKWVTYGFLGALIVMGRYWEGWWLWAGMIFFFARSHPPIYDQSPIGSGRAWLGFVALLVFLLCFTIAPMAV